MAKFDIERFPDSVSAKRMLSYVTPGWYDNSYVGKWLYEVMGREIDSAEGHVEDLLAQLFPETATWGIKYHELKYGLDVRENLSLEERRRRIIEKRDTKAPMTPWRMEYVLGGLIDCDISVTDIMEGAEVSHPNIFVVRLSGDGEIGLGILAKVLNETKQSHTTYDVHNNLAVFELEEEITGLIRYRMCFPWWNWCLDGKYYLDGSRCLDSVFPPFISARIRARASLEEVFKDSSIFILPTIRNDSEVISGVRERFEMRWHGFDSILDGTYDLDGSVYLNNTGCSLRSRTKFRFPARQSEEVRTFWHIPDNSIFLNGTEGLDGTFLLSGGTEREEL